MIRLFNHYLSVRTLLLTTIEAAVLFQAVVMGFEVRFVRLGGPLPIAEAGVFTVVMLLLMTALGLYQEQTEPFRSTVQRLLVAYGLALMVMSAVFYVFPATYIGRGVFAMTSVLALAGVVMVRLLFFRVTDLGLPRRRVLVVGNGPECEEVIRFLHEGERSRSIQYAGIYPVIAEREAGEPERRINHDQLRRTVDDLRVSEIVIAVRERRGGVLPLRHLLDCKLKGVKVMDLTSFYERELGVLKVDNLRASWLIFSHGFDQGLVRDMIKRSFDVLASLSLLILALPVLALAMLAILLESGRPIFYRQERVGQGGVPFMILKLRTMVQDAEKDGQPRWAGQNDARITPVGRFLRRTRIDELPQLINVLRGDMSLVGPRPEQPEYVALLSEEIPYYRERHCVRPGITGWAQLSYPYGASQRDAEEKLQYDLYYIRHQSLFFDALILLQTVEVVLFRKGAR